MPFELLIEEVERHGDEVAVTGRLSVGAYAGPEVVLVFDQNGKMWRAPVLSHSMEYLGEAEWPIRADHQTVLTLDIRLPKGAQLDPSKPVVGIGNDAECREPEDYMKYLDDPRLWSVLLHETLCDEEGDAHYEWLSTSLTGSSVFFKTMLAAIKTGRTPTLHFVIDAEWGLIWNATEGAEYRHTLILEDRTRKREITLGWLSGHFAKPALRVRELAEIAKRLSAAGYSPYAALAFAEYCGGDGPDILAPEAHRNLFYPLFRALPGVTESAAELVCRNFDQSTSSETPTWRFDGTLGWINDYPHSLRNPEAVGCLSVDDFAAVSRFFRS